ncbi:glycosyltransferase family 2 protein [Coniophora puteana RWD-64-598 SS2]|uniref:chitin synthase n=1 Tax=Coniophora puteana (strain RWD-64-598) TaxID=741705 RepID=A0A5M3MVM6_CONPW|nr:glycosyltransferase family 2 protein [Coniophora puteana RWD-64-598 SS2]EIW83186.1 glycosyltransferase family 2 protein [Coniophora puteana RWD-64-598 SS2]
MASAPPSVVPQAISSGELADLISTTGTATLYPSDDAILAVLHARFRADLPYTSIGTTNLVVLNPCKSLASVNDASAKEYEERCYKETKLGLTDARRAPQPHVYDLAAKIYLLMRRRNEPQAVIARGVTGSGKTASSRLLVDQLLRLSAHSKKEGKLVEQIKAFDTLLQSFGHAKTQTNANASRFIRYTELHFNYRGRINSTKVLAFGLDKSRLARLSHDERSYHVFYQLLAGATPSERDYLGLEGPPDYALLASSGCYRLPAGPFNDDGISCDDLRAAMKVLGFKSKHVSSIWSVLTAILVLSNIEFAEADSQDTSAYVLNLPILQHAARLLGVAPEDLSDSLTYKTTYVRKELYTVLLNAQQSTIQRDQLIRNLYAILFAFIVESANHKLAPTSAAEALPSKVILLDQPGFQSRTSETTATTVGSTLISAERNGFDEFCINFADEVIQSHIFRNIFDDNAYHNSQALADGIPLPQVEVLDNAACTELLRGPYSVARNSRKPSGLLGVADKASSSYKSGKGGESRNDDLLQEMSAKFGMHTSFVKPSSPDEKRSFSIKHYVGPCSYDTSNFVEKNADIIDPAFVTLLRESSDTFVTKLVSGPGLSTELHEADNETIVQAQISLRPLRSPSSLGAAEDSSPRLNPAKIYPVTTQLNQSLWDVLAAMDNAKLWTLSCIRPNDNGFSNSFDKRRVKSQIRALLLPSVVARRSLEYVASMGQTEFCDRYCPTTRGSTAERIRQCARSYGWVESSDYAMGQNQVWLSYFAWKVVEDVLRTAEKEQKNMTHEDSEDDDSLSLPHEGTMDNQPSPVVDTSNYRTSYFDGSPAADYPMSRSPAGFDGYAPSHFVPAGYPATPAEEAGSMYKAEAYGDTPPLVAGTDLQSVPKDHEQIIEEQLPATRQRRIWLFLVTITTFFIPDFLLSWLGRMKRPDVRLAWREKFTIFFLILLLNGIVLFYIIVFGRLLCPNFDKAWTANEVAQHTGTNDFYVSIQGKVYDVSNFVHGDHSDISGEPSNGEDTLDYLAGTDLTYYFPPPLTLACSGLVIDTSVAITIKNSSSMTVPTAKHSSGAQAPTSNTALDNTDWYTATYLPKINQYYKGALVWEPSDISGQAADTNIERVWAIYDNSIYDLTDYVYTTTSIDQNVATYQFLDKNLVDVFTEQAGQDITSSLNSVLDAMGTENKTANMDCLNNAFYWGETDFRYTARCQVQNVLLLVFSSILMASMGLKFLAALQLGHKKHPELLDKFVLCQVPCYTEGEDSLRRTIDSLAALDYDDKRKLIFIICDGNIIGGGNERPTPSIVLDILGVNPSHDPEPLMFKSIGEGSQKLNYGKIYSGLYEFEGHVVPYVVVVKVGKPTERSRPGNRGKRDSQILLLQYLNRVHFNSPMSPLELEIYHQMRNVIGIDPAFYEYIFTVDADTTVTPPSLNRLVASAADDSNIIGICGETKLQNEEGSWWTMIQVYEYYISHNLSKAFESLFGSVSCLPGCFTLYRIRTADKGRPVIISSRVIDEYAENHVDTLHKKNLFSLGEDRFLTTLLMKHFPTYKTKFTSEAIARTVAPVSWRVLFSQRRRWINSTVHNLCELALLPDLCGVCCFSMRFFVYLDLIGTLILPATVIYLLYLIIVVSSGQSAFPLISIIMIAVVYGLQALIFIIKREFMLVGWMVVYLLSYPVYSFFLPIYSFWRMDEFGWGNTRVVLDAGGNKKVITNTDDRFNETMIPYKTFAEYEAETWESQSNKNTGLDANAMNSGYSMHMPPSQPRLAPSAQMSSYNTHGSVGGDYYRDTNMTNPNSRTPSRPASRSAHPSFYPSASQEKLNMAPPSYHPMASGGMGSVYGMTPPGSQMNMSMHGTGSLGGLGGPPQLPFGNGGGMRPNSTFSMATTVFAGPNTNPNPSDEELYTALRNYLSTQDLMTVTKKTAREAIAARFPRADLTSRRDFLNQAIDSILSSP